MTTDGIKKDCVKVNRIVSN